MQCIPHVSNALQEHLEQEMMNVHHVLLVNFHFLKWGLKLHQTASAFLDTTNQESFASHVTQGSTRQNMALKAAQSVLKIPSVLGPQ
jgi:hypothetical protein